MGYMGYVPVNSLLGPVNSPKSVSYTKSLFDTVAPADPSSAGSPESFA